MGLLVLWALVSAAFIGGSEGATWCVCKNEMSAVALQKTIDYACGAGADCGAIHQKGGCYEPNTVIAHCSYAANSYFQRKGQAPGSCDFSGTAAVTGTDPSYSGCGYPSSVSAAGTGTGTPTTVAPGTAGTPPTTATTSTGGTPAFNPGGGSSSTDGVLGSGLGPSAGVTTDGSGVGGSAGAFGCAAALVLSGLVLLRAW